eukprot:CAMPEP_0204916286 /NCGR_PEP_ID=MMETSP1397-20131031/14144_1 /ASSEMBLY_ACC=CAM_ASM_000891 /TAXON_ID=49980 /ORGANISM="Climacostomum Climacostomum virens, Strain Stock W-24" /LENGTH=275 /DNA_ID=CAMNT_0052088739 /DNA_START=670 /DNA_END=1498 /DNA_ORIENTATION=+
MGDILIAKGEVSELDTTGVVLFDCSESLSSSLPGAYHLDWRGDPGRVLAYMEVLGLKKDAEIVCFSKWGIEDAARVWWVLAKHDYTNVRIINSSIKCLHKLGTKLVAEPERLQDVLSLPLDTDYILNSQEDAPTGEDVAIVNTTEDSLQYVSLLSGEAGLKPCSKIEMLLEHLNDASSIVASGNLAGTLLLALTIIGHSNLYWLFGVRTLTGKACTYSVVEEQFLNIKESNLFEVLDVPIEPLSRRVTFNSHTKLQQKKKLPCNEQQVPCVTAVV